MIMDRRSSLGSLGCVIGALTLFGCAAQTGEDQAVSSQSALEGADPVEFTPFEDPGGIAAVGDGEIRRVVESAREYQRVFGHAPPDGVDLSGRGIAIFYSPGVKNTGGYEASIESVEVRSRTLYVTTRLSSPGEGCIVTQSLTHPHAFAELKRPRGVTRVRFLTDDVVRDCTEPAPTCDDAVCPAGQHCELVDVVCIRAPCPPLPECVEDEPAPTTCGGFGGFPCPDKLSCVDDPRDDCDPNNGGADCGGICVCDILAKCQAGYVFDRSTDVCACVPDPTLDPCAAVRCKAGTHCVADGDAASCVTDGPFCGGFGGFPCPGSGQCEDNPGDGCSPENGGADCGGICTCNIRALCIQGYAFDPSPEVCACVPETNPCAAILCIEGTQCEVVDGKGTCVPQDNPCAAILCLEGTQCEVVDGKGVCQEICGKSTCSEGTTCCNASCGMCAPPGFACIQIACE
jgi:hypothetical protein